MPDSSAPKSAQDAFLPLSKLTVLDLTIARAGPTAVRHLADWGANVIHIDSPTAKEDDLTGIRDGHDFQNLHRNKRMILLDLKNPAGHAAFMRLVQKADGIRATIVNGAVAFEGGEATGSNAGTVLKGRRSA